MNKDLILREKLALQRTILANQSTFLSFLRTSMYFLMAGLSLTNLLLIENGLFIEIGLFVASFIIFVLGTFNFFKHRKSILENKKHISIIRWNITKSKKKLLINTLDSKN